MHLRILLGDSCSFASQPNPWQDFKTFSLDLLCVFECLASMYVCVLCARLIPGKVRRGHWVPWNRSYNYEPTCGCQGPSAGLLSILSSPQGFFKLRERSGHSGLLGWKGIKDRKQLGVCLAFPEDSRFFFPREPSYKVSHK